MNRDRFDEWAMRYRDRLQSEQSRDEERQDAMNRVNPKYVLRNYLAQIAIEKAQQKDFAEIDRFLLFCNTPIPTSLEWPPTPRLRPIGAST